MYLSIYLFSKVNMEVIQMMLDRVLRHLQDPGCDLKRVARETGLKYTWLFELRRGRFKDPGVQKIEALDSYFRTAA